MNILSKAFCRVYQFCFRMAGPVLPYRNPETYSKIEEIGNIFDSLGAVAALVVTDKFLAESPAMDKLREISFTKGVKLNVFTDFKPNPTVKNCEDGARMYNSCSCNCIIALGGGSAIDCAKGVGILIAYPKKTLAQLKGLLRVMRSLPPLVAIPTTAGTGSEVTPTAVITDDTTHHKYTINSFPLIPHYAILDPEVTFSLPAHLTATTGMDALTHAVEAYIGNSTTKETRAYALKAVQLIFENIKTAYTCPRDKAARENMLRASYMAGIAFSKSYVGYIHAVAHSLGGMYDIPHGLANSVLMPIVLKSYGKSVYCKLKKLAVVAGVADKADSPEDASIKFVQAIESLNEDMGIPKVLKGIKKEDIPSMAKRASKEANPLYPVPVIMNSRELMEFYYTVADWRE